VFDSIEYVFSPISWKIGEIKMFTRENVFEKMSKENDPLHEWFTFEMIKPPIGEEVLAYSPEWIHLDFNPKGIRVGFLIGDEN